ncbi:MAG: cytochrome P450 [Actinomycetota bacterium]|nr:cytochrome P450 [Actinomycetota bacterium]
MTDADPQLEALAPVEDFATDWDYSDPQWVNDPFPIWEDLRGRCPMAHSKRFNRGMWLPLSFDDVVDIAGDTETFSSRHFGIQRGEPTPRGHLPPIHSDPPEHMPLRRLLLPFFAPQRVERWRADIDAHCNELAAAIAERGEGDAAVDYAQHIPVAAIATILGIDASMGDEFRHWVTQLLELGPRDPSQMVEALESINAYMGEVMEQRRADPGDDLISHLVTAELDGELLDDDLIQRMLVLQLVAGIDTTWSSIGSALVHLAQNEGDRRRLVDEPELLPTAIEELLRAYAPVNVTRIVTEDTEVNGVQMQQGDHVLMTFPIACRDPEKFERADEVVIDRAENRHIAFGAGIHRCLGSNLARLEMELAVGAFLRHIPEFELAPGAEVTWSTGQIRGPRSVPIVVTG